MTKILTITLFLTFSAISAQKINDVIPDILNSREIRIIRSYNLGESDIFRLFQLPSSDWKYEFYKSTEKENFELIETKTIPKKEDYDKKLWLRILMTDIQNILDYKRVSYKFKKSKEIIFLDNSWTLFYEQPMILDGESFKILIKEENKFNEVLYSNPDSYLEIYPEIDELNSVVNLLQLIRNEFKIWQP